MEINTEEFSIIVKSLLPATKNKNTSPQVERIIFQDNFAGTFNSKMAVSWELDLGGIKCSVLATDLDKILSGIQDDKVSVYLEKNKLVIKSKGTTAKISTFPETKLVEDFYNSINFDGLDWQTLPDVFITQLNIAKFSTSSNEFDPQNLFCVLIDTDFIYSGNGYRCTKMKCDSGFNCLIPKQAVDSITKFPEINGYALTNGWIHFTNDDGGIISSKIVKGNFPDITKILENFPGGAVIKLSKSLIAPLKAINNVLAKDADFLKTVNITIEQGRTILKGTKEGLNIEKVIPNKFKSDKVSFDISPVFLKELLEQGICDSVRIINNIAIFEADGFSHLVTLPIL